MLPVMLKLYTSRLGDAARAADSARCHGEIENNFGFLDSRARESRLLRAATTSPPPTSISRS
jgi:hypothetical protein